MTSIQPFLSPIAGENPCGTDISYDPAFLDLETLAKGKEETQFSAAEEPNWREIQAAALELLAKSKHLRLGILATVALLQVDGLPGFSNGLALLAGWMKNYWDGLYPALDPDDNNDPTERVNLLQILSSQDAAGERVLQRLANAPLAESPKMGRYTLKAILEAQGKPEIAAAFQDTDKETLRLRYDAAVNAAAAVAEMQQSLKERLGAERAPNFHDLDKTLQQISSQIAPYLGIAAPPGLEAGSQPPAAGGQEAGPGAAVGSIANRADVVRALGAICSYYRTHEPASPIPLLLERAQRLVNKEFIEIIADLAPDSLAQINVVTGRKPEENK